MADGQWAVFKGDRLRCQHNLTAEILANKAQAIPVAVQFPEAWIQVTLDPPILQLVPVSVIDSIMIAFCQVNSSAYTCFNSQPVSQDLLLTFINRTAACLKYSSRERPDQTKDIATALRAWQ